MTPTPTWNEQQRARERSLLTTLSGLPADDPARAAVRDELVTMHLPLVQHLARRYRDRGESVEDLVQVGTIGLIKAVDGFDVERGTEFSTYATPTILGEIKRHFRDRAWTVRVPRRLQELQSRISTRTEELTRDLHRSPTVRELAAALDVTEDDVLDALEARHAYAVSSLDDDGDEGDGWSTSSVLGVEETAFAEIDQREALLPLLAQLPERERRILQLRFGENMSQSAIAQELGISQMHVSRLLARSLARLRAGLAEDD